MNNYQQKLFLLCALLFGCVLTSIGVEYFGKDEAPINLPPPSFVRKQEKNLQVSLTEGKRVEKQTKQVTGRVNINTATVQELDSLPGIGPVIAQRIVEYRGAKPFTKIEELMLVKGIGKKKFAKLRELITVE